MHVIILKNTPDLKMMALVDADCDADSMEGHVLSIQDVAHTRGIRLELESKEEDEEVWETVPSVENRWPVLWTRDYRLMLGNECVLTIETSRCVEIYAPDFPSANPV